MGWGANFEKYPVVPLAWLSWAQDEIAPRAAQPHHWRG